MFVQSPLPLPLPALLHSWFLSLHHNVFEINELCGHTTLASLWKKRGLHCIATIFFVPKKVKKKRKKNISDLIPQLKFPIVYQCRVTW